MKLNASQGTVTAEEAYFDAKLPSAIGGTMLVGDYLYGGVGQNSLMCVVYKTGEIKWNERSIAPASLCYAEGLLYMHGEGVTWRSSRRHPKLTGNGGVLRRRTNRSMAIRWKKPGPIP